VIGTAGYSIVSQRMHPMAERLGRSVQTLYFDVSSATDRASLQKPSTRVLLDGPKIFVLGDEARLEALLSKEGSTHGQKKKSRQPHQRRKTGAARR
jgi:hypothetical protein